MNFTLQFLLDYLVKVSFSTFNQLFLLFGPLIFLSLIMHLVAKKNEQLSYQVFGRKVYLFFFGWLGTAIHEIGHAVFAVLFGHKITEMKLFTPNAKDGSLGCVTHTYNRKNIYQSSGNFFIGIGPILFGSFILFLVSNLLFGFDFSKNFLENLTQSISFDFSFLKLAFIAIFESFKMYLLDLYTSIYSHWWKVALFIYLIYSIGSSITLSTSDLKGSFLGFSYIVATFFLFNLSTLWLGDFAIIFFKKISHLLSNLYFLIILSILINSLFLIMLLIMRGVVKLITNR